MKKALLRSRTTSLLLIVALVYTMMVFAFADSFAQDQEEPEDVTQPIEDTLRLDRNDNKVITVSWDEIEGADYYTIAIDGEEARDSRDEDAAFNGQSYTFENVDPKISHSIKLSAYKIDTGAEEDKLLSESELNNIYAHVTVSTNRKGISSGDRWPRKQSINLRSAIGEKRTGYSVVQGGATDGTYAYNLLVSPYSQKGRILKTRLSDNSVVAKSSAININHGNGMAYDSLRNRLVIVGRNSRRNQLVIVNVGAKEKDDPTFAGYRYINYEYSGKWTSNKENFDSHGIGAIAYVEKYDCYIAVQRTTKDLLVLNPEFKVIGKIYTKILVKYPGLYQAIDADERYVYFLLSPYNKKQPNNIILVLDWHGEKLLDYANGRKGSDYISAVWKCGTDGSPSAVIKTHTPHEAENIYHVYNEDSGRSRFYLSEYHNNPKYKWITKKKAYKVKWKKVKKKVKWKKVKRKGKWKWKYKTKKVWKYKKKYKKYKVKVLNYYNRDNYVYDLGEI